MNFNKDTTQTHRLFINNLLLMTNSWLLYACVCVCHLRTYLPRSVQKTCERATVVFPSAPLEKKRLNVPAHRHTMHIIYSERRRIFFGAQSLIFHSDRAKFDCLLIVYIQPSVASRRIVSACHQLLGESNGASK